MERPAGFEPAFADWHSAVLPLDDGRRVKMVGAAGFEPAWSCSQGRWPATGPDSEFGGPRARDGLGSAAWRSRGPLPSPWLWGPNGAGRRNRTSYERRAPQVYRLLSHHGNASGIWCERRDSNSQRPAPRAGAYAASATLALVVPPGVEPGISTLRGWRLSRFAHGTVDGGA